MERSVTDCVQAGLRSLRANWALVPALWLQILVVTLLTAAGLVPLLAATGFDASALLAGDGDQVLATALGWAEGLAEVTWRDLIPRSPAVWAALGALTVLWGLAAVAGCWFQAGLFAILTAGERRAGPHPAGWRPYTAFGWTSFFRLGRRFLWRFFGLLHLAVIYLLVPQVLLVLVMALAAVGLDRWGGAAAVGIGCLGALPAALLAAALFLWLGLAQAALARPGSGVNEAGRRAFAVLGRRPGAVLALGALLAVLALAASMLPLPLDLLAAGRLEGAPALLWRVGREAVGWLVYGGLSTFSGATLVALMAGEAPVSPGGA